MKTKAVFMSMMLLLTIVAKADIAPNPVSAATVKPMDSTSVRMVSEIVKVELYKDSSMVEVLFEMRNLGKPETVEVGFPIMDYYFGWKKSLFVGQRNEGDRFQVWVDDKPVKDIKIYGFRFQDAALTAQSAGHLKHEILDDGNKARPNGNYPDETERNASGKAPRKISPQSYFDDFSVQPWYIWHTIFPEGETRWVKVRYTLPAGVTKHSNFFNYLLHTGANWNGTIGKATVIVKIHDIPENEIYRISPDGYTKNENIITWNFNDFEPVKHDDVFIYYQKENVKSNPESADVYLDNKNTNLNLIEPQNIASFNVVKDDMLNFPNGAVFIYSKEFHFALFKEMVKKYSMETFKKLAALKVDDFYEKYSLKIGGGEAKNPVRADDLSTVEKDIENIDIEQDGDAYLIVVQLKAL